MTAPKLPQEGGAFVADDDGKLVREEFTRRRDEPEHAEKPTEKQPARPARNPR